MADLIQADETYSQALHRVMTRAVVSIEDVAVVLDISLNSARKAVAAGELDTITVGKLKKAVTSPLRKRLSLYDQVSGPAQQAA